MPDSRLRAFVALAFAPAVREELARAMGELREALPPDVVRWVPPQNLHLTLSFLGDIDPETVAPVLESLECSLSDFAAFDATLGAVRLFPSATRARVVAARIEPAAPVLALAAAVEAATTRCGFAPEAWRFRPHITLGRFRGRAPKNVDLNVAITPDPVEVRDVVLFRSVLGRAGATYTELGRASLRPGTC